jgi:hypothetical protein
LDGALIAIDMKTIGDLEFDSQFDFSYYDLDLCLGAALKKLAVGTWNISIHHTNMPNYDTDSFRNNRERFRQKWKELFAHSKPT